MFLGDRGKSTYYWAGLDHASIDLHVWRAHTALVVVLLQWHSQLAFYKVDWVASLTSLASPHTYIPSIPFPTMYFSAILDWFDWWMLWLGSWANLKIVNLLLLWIDFFSELYIYLVAIFISFEPCIFSTKYIGLYPPRQNVLEKQPGHTENKDCYNVTEIFLEEEKIYWIFFFHVIYLIVRSMFSWWFFYCINKYASFYTFILLDVFYIESLEFLSFTWNSEAELS